MKLQLISFDLDGTLVDTAAEIAEAVNRALVSCGHAPRAPDDIKRLIGAGAHELMRRLFEGAPPPDIEALLASFDHHYAALAGSIARPYPGCAAALTQLRDAGLQLACVTNKERAHAARVLSATALDGYFTQLIGGDTLPWKKPDARVLRHLARQTGVAVERCAHLGDSATDVAAARNAGFAAWAVPYGYNAGVPIVGFCGVDFKSGGKTLRNGRAKGFSVACSIGAVTTWPICGSSTTSSEKSRGPGYSIGELAPRLAAPDPGLA